VEWGYSASSPALATRRCLLPFRAILPLGSGGAFRLQRIIASLLLVVLSLSPLAPAALASVQPVPQHCARQPLITPAASSGMHCHDAAHARHSMADASASTSAPVSDNHQFRSNGCCSSHDCCNSNVRAQWAQFVPAVIIVSTDLVQGATAANPVSPCLASRFDTNSGRAPPVV